MELQNCSTEIFVKDIGKSKDFYNGILEIPIDLNMGKNVILKNGITLWEIQKYHIIPAALGLDKVTGISTNRFEIYFESDNLTQIYNTLKSKGIRFLHEINEEPWGQLTIRFFDPDNHLIKVGESIRQFVNRFYIKGLTVEQISQRTSVPVEEVKRLIKIKPKKSI